MGGSILLINIKIISEIAFFKLEKSHIKIVKLNILSICNQILEFILIITKKYGARWMGSRAGLRIAYSNQKLRLQVWRINLHTKEVPICMLNLTRNAGLKSGCSPDWASRPGLNRDYFSEFCFQSISKPYKNPNNFAVSFLLSILHKNKFFTGIIPSELLICLLVS